MAASVLRPAELTAAQVEAWRAAAAAMPAPVGPFLSPDWARLVGRYCPTAQVITCASPQGSSLFLAVDVVGRSAEPLGRSLSDQHAILAGAVWDIRPILRAVGVDELRLDHYVGAVDGRGLEVLRSRSTYLMSLVRAEGAPRSPLLAGSRLAKDVARLRRRLSEDHGPLRFELQEHDPDLLDTLIRHKSAQYERTGGTDIFQHDWVRAVAEDLPRHDSPGLRGMLSVLYAGDTPVALHLGVRNERVAHWWLPTYDPAFARYSPGMLLLAELAAALEPSGVQVLDLGPGDEPYKTRVSTEQSAVLSVYARSAGVGSQARRLVRGAVRRLPTGRG